MALQMNGFTHRLSQANLRAALHWDGISWTPLPPNIAAAAAPAGAVGEDSAASDAISDAAAGSARFRKRKPERKNPPPEPYQVGDLGVQTRQTPVLVLIKQPQEQLLVRPVLPIETSLLIHPLLQVPDGFTAADLGGELDASSDRAACRSVADVFVRRFTSVRSQVCCCCASATFLSDTATLPPVCRSPDDCQLLLQ